MGAAITARIALEQLEDRCVLDAVSFTGAAMTADWRTAGNWSTGAIPTQNDGVTIPAGKTCDAAGGGDCKTLTVNGTLNVVNTLQVQVKVYDGASYGMASFYVTVMM